MDQQTQHDPGPDPSRRLAEIDRGLDPRMARSWAIESLEELFRAGAPPDPAPDGFLAGRLVATSIWAPADAVIRRVTGVWMPWIGKSFDANAASGLNFVRPSARRPMKVLWRSYEPERTMADRLEIFGFKTRLGEAALDDGVKVLKIEYDLAANPDRIIRRVLDELVQVDESTYLGKILFRVGSRYRRIGFFSLRK